MARKVDMLQVIKNFKGEEMRLQGVPMTLREALTTALAQQQDQRPAKEQYTLFALGLRIANRDEVEFTSEEITTLKNACSRTYTPIITGRVWQILEGLTDKDVIG